MRRPNTRFTPSSSTASRDGNISHRYAFSNGWEGSVIMGPYTYGGERGLWEVAAIFDGEVVGDTKGWLRSSQVDAELQRISELPNEGNLVSSHEGKIRE